jgi:hypothetical protein
MDRQCVTVDLGDRSYPIHIGENLLDDASFVDPASRHRWYLYRQQ